MTTHKFDMRNIGYNLLISMRNTNLKMLVIALAVTVGLSGAGYSQTGPEKRADVPAGECRIPKERQGNTDWFSRAGWGLFVHYLYDSHCDGGNIANTEDHTSWDDMINKFDTERFAADVAETGASYVIFTMMQRTRHLIAPNETYNQLTGYKTGEACSSRDLVKDLIESLDKYDIKLMLYWTGDGPRQDKQASEGMGGWDGQVTDEYVRNWAKVAAEYGNCYGEKVYGWWVDGCYEFTGYNQERWSMLAEGLRAGNPRRIIALNNPSGTHANSSSREDDFTTGEVSNFGDVPSSRWVDGVQWHILSYLGKYWCTEGLRYDRGWLAQYIYKCNQAGGVVSIDVLLFSDGTLERSHMVTLKGANKMLNEIRRRDKGL